MDKIPKLDILNARTIKFECPEGVIVDYLTNDKGNIVSVNYGGNKANISVGAKFVFDMSGSITNYDIEEIEISSDNNRIFLLNTHKLTKATSFLTPIISLVQDSIGYKTTMINCHIRTYRDKPEQLVLLHRNIRDTEFKKIVENLEALPMFVESMVHNKFFRSFIFNIPDNFRRDLELFMDGKYSSLSEVLKSRIIRFHKLKKSGMLYKILYRDVTLKKFIEMDLNEEIPDNLDLYSVPERETEIIEI